MALLDLFPSLYGLVGNAKNPLRHASRTESVQLAQDLVDSICQSAPFHLGNYIKPASLSELMVPTILCASYHDLDPSHISYTLYQKSSLPTSRDDHRRHVVVQGPWHSGCHVLVQALREVQMSWIRTQFLRVLRLLRIDPKGLSTNNQDHCQGDLGDHCGLNAANAKIIAKILLAALAR